MPDLLKAALWYAAKGQPVFPLVPGAKNPLNEHGASEATTDPGRIEAWWKGTPNANIGGECGHLFDALDVDEGGEDTLLGYDPIPRTPETRTPSGGKHVLMAPSVVPLKNAVKFLPGLDFRTKGGYIVLPPSVNCEAGWKWTTKLGEVPLAQVPMWIVQLLKRSEEGEAGSRSAKPEEALPEGARNDRLFKFACLQRRLGLTQTEIRAALDAINRERCKPPLTSDEIAKIAESAAKYDPASKIHEPKVDAPIEIVAKSGMIGEFRTTGSRRGCATGFRLIDDNTRTVGLPDGQMSVVSAYTGVGKSAFMLQVAFNVASRGEPVCYATFADLPGGDLYDRLVSLICGWNGGDPPTQSDLMYERWAEARDTISALPIEVYDASEIRHGREVEAFESWLRERKDRFRLVCVDYAQELRTQDRNYRGMYEQAEECCAIIRWLAAETMVPILIGSQLTEGSEKQGTRDITKGSRVWEERAAVHIKFRRFDEKEIEKLDFEYRGIRGISMAHMVKNRFGRSNLREYCQWSDSRLRFEELT